MSLAPFFVPEGGRTDPSPGPSESRGMKNPKGTRGGGWVYTRRVHEKPKTEIPVESGFSDRYQDWEAA